MRRRLVLGGAIALGALACSPEAYASETQAYAYDALGRLTLVRYSGTVNAGQAHSLCYDPAGNRMVYRSNAAGALADCPSSPSPAPNQPPVAGGDSTSMTICSLKTVNVVANDTDADGDLPLKVVGVSPGTGVLAAVSGTTSIALESTSEVGNFLISYTIEDARGATGVGDLEVAVTGGSYEAIEVMFPLIDDDGAWIELKGLSYTAFYCANVVDALDIERTSNILENVSGSFHTPRFAPVLRRDVLGENHAFRLPQSTSKIFVSEAFKQAYDAARLTGLEFIAVPLL